MTSKEIASLILEASITKVDASTPTSIDPDYVRQEYNRKVLSGWRLKALMTLDAEKRKEYEMQAAQDFGEKMGHPNVAGYYDMEGVMGAVSKDTKNQPNQISLRDAVTGKNVLYHSIHDIPKSALIGTGMGAVAAPITGGASIPVGAAIGAGVGAALPVAYAPIKIAGRYYAGKALGGKPEYPSNPYN